MLLITNCKSNSKFNILYNILGPLLFLVFAPVLIDTTMISEIRLIIIYFASLILVLSPSK